jgi:hypothetical protein
VQFNSSDKKFKTLNVDVIATLPEGGQTVRKREGIDLRKPSERQVFQHFRQARKKRESMTQADGRQSWLATRLNA